MIARNHSMRGFSVVEFALALVLVSIAVGLSVPPILTALERENERIALNRNLADIFEGMDTALGYHWQTTQCRSAPNTNLEQLIAWFAVPSAVKAHYAPNVQFIRDNYPPYNARMLRITLHGTSAAQATSLSKHINLPAAWVSLHGNRVFIERPVKVIDSRLQHANFNTQNGCLQ